MNVRGFERRRKKLPCKETMVAKIVSADHTTIFAISAWIAFITMLATG